MFFKSFLCLVDNKRTEIARVVLCENNFCTKYAHHLHFCGLQKLNTLNLRYLHPPLNPCNHFSTVLIKTNWYTISCKYYGCTSLTSVEMPLTITKIGDQAFYGCTALVRQDIPSNVTEIGSEAFCGCSQLIDLTIPSGIKSIGENRTGERSCADGWYAPQYARLLPQIPHTESEGDWQHQQCRHTHHPEDEWLQ